MLANFLKKIIDELRMCSDTAGIDKILGESITKIYEIVPEFLLYKGSARSSVEAAMHTSSATIRYYGIDLTMEEARAMLGGHCFLLSLAGTETAYNTFVRKQHLVPGRKPILSFGKTSDILAEHSFLGMHNFLMQTPSELQSGMFYAALINDLGKTDYVKALYKDQFAKDPEDSDEALGKILQVSKEFPAYNAFEKGIQILIMSCFNIPCTFSELQQIERPKQAAKKFSGIPKEVLSFHFIMETWGDIPGAVLPPPESDGNMVAACQTMHAETAQHLALLHQCFIQNVDRDREFDFVKAYQEYADARLRLVGIIPEEKGLESILPIVKFAVGVSRTGSRERGAQVLAMANELPDCVKRVLFREIETLGLERSIYILNIVALVMGPFYIIAPKVKEGMTVGLCIAAYLYEETRKNYPFIRQNEFKGNATQIANLFNINVIADIKNKIIPLYDALKNITTIEQVAANVSVFLEHQIYAVPASNGIRFLSRKLEKNETLMQTATNATSDKTSVLAQEQKVTIDSLAQADKVKTLFSPKSSSTTVAVVTSSVSEDHVTKRITSPVIPT